MYKFNAYSFDNSSAFYFVVENNSKTEVDCHIYHKFPGIFGSYKNDYGIFRLKPNERVVIDRTPNSSNKIVGPFMDLQKDKLFADFSSYDPTGNTSWYNVYTVDKFYGYGTVLKSGLRLYKTDNMPISSVPVQLNAI